MKWLVYLVSLLRALEICRTCMSVASIFFIKLDINHQIFIIFRGQKDEQKSNERNRETVVKGKWSLNASAQHYKFPFLDINLFDK